MFFRQVLHEDLGCASYVIGSDGVAAVVDPKWDIREYLELAAEHGLRIEHVLETHNHADHLSGRGRLIAATGASAHISAEAGVEYEHEPLRDGDVVAVGSAEIRALATPGHRPEHMAFLVADTKRGNEPWLLISGDSLFVGDSARPDLAVEAVEGARGLFDSFGRLAELDDFVELWPGHIGGSLCGGAGMSEKPGSTIGFERLRNRYFPASDREEFVRSLTESTRPQPPNFKRIVELNRGPLITSAPPPEPIAPARAQELAGEGAALIDTRETHEFDAAHVPGSINVTATKAGVGTRAAWMTDPSSPVVIVASSDEEGEEATLALQAVGFSDIRGYVAGGIEAWRAAGLPLESMPAIGIAELAERLRTGEAVLLDVREDDEWEKAHVPGSIHVPYYELRGDIPAEIENADVPVAVACSGGYRSALAASVLKARGVQDVLHVADGGVGGLAAHGIELER